jgi:hypothetical protein
MRKTDYSKFINSISHDELKEEMEMLYEKYKDVKKHYTMELGTEKDRMAIFNSAKKTITKSYSRRGYRPKSPKLMKLNNTIKELESISIFDHELIDFYLFNIETALTFNKEYGYYSEPFENFVERNFIKTLDKIEAAALITDFEDRLLKLVNVLAPKTIFRHMIMKHYNS